MIKQYVCTSKGENKCNNNKKKGQIQKMTIKKHLKIQNLENKTSFDKKKKIRENGQKNLYGIRYNFDENQS
jgi:hypothetical protein